MKSSLLHAATAAPTRALAGPVERRVGRPVARLIAAGLAAIAATGPLGGCATSATAPATKTPWISATSTHQWNDYATDLIARNAVGQVGALRSLAYLNLAINNAIAQAGSGTPAAEGAVAGASAAVLAALFAKDEAATHARLAREVQAIGAGQRAAFQSGVARGQKVGEQVVALARADRIGDPWTGSVPTGDDTWASRAQPPAPPLAPALGKVRTFVLTSGDAFRAPPPPAMNSAAFQAQLAEVRTLSDTRTNAQLRVAQHWENLSGAFAAGAWNGYARNAMAAQGYDEATTASVLATMHMAGFDAIVACHESKYVYWVPRPTQVDPKITLAVSLPNHPSYPSNHSCISGAMGRVLDASLPNTGGMYERMARHAGESRLFGGIHYPMDLDAGDEIARKVAARALQVGPKAGQAYTPAGR